jgi:hypothetical protein
MSDKKPVIFISYSHKDEPEKPAADEVAWLTFVQSFLAPVVKVGIFDIWVDEHLHGGDALDPEIKKKLAACDIFVLLASRFSLASTYVVETEIATIRQRQKDGQDVHMFPVLLSPVPDAALKQLKDLLLRPKNGEPFSTMSRGDRESAMSAIADEIAALADEIAKRKIAVHKTAAPEPESGAVIAAAACRVGHRRTAQHFVDISRLPETAYERLVGRETEIKYLDDAWADRKINILSLIAEGGAGKSALVNEWLRRLQADDYRDAEIVLGWSFYSQGSKERSTSAEGFFNWTLDRLGIKIEGTTFSSATAKGEAIAEVIGKRRLLLVLDGCEPLQHGPDSQRGELKDPSLRALLRRFAAMPRAETQGLVVLTSRLAVKDIARWKEGAASVVDVEKLSDEAGAELLRDNSVWGTDKQLKGAAHSFGGHPLALGLLASFLKETQFGDIRRRDHIRHLFLDVDNPGHDHAKRVMESYEREWLSAQPLLLAIMHMIGLFDRPASGDCLKVLLENPVISGFPELISDVSEEGWNRAISRLRDVRLLSPGDASNSNSLDAHPLVRDWFGDRFRQRHVRGWAVAHGRLYEYLRDTTKEGKTPTLEDLAPLQQAVVHGCSAGRHQEAWDQVFQNRLVRKLPTGQIENYMRLHLGAAGSVLASVSWFFSKPYQNPSLLISPRDKSRVLGEAATCLRALGRFREALQAQRGQLEDLQTVHYDSKYSSHKISDRLAIILSHLAQMELSIGDIAAAQDSASQSVRLIDRGKHIFWKVACRAVAAAVVHAKGQRDVAEHLFEQAELQLLSRGSGFLFSTAAYQFCELLLAKADWLAAVDKARKALEFSRRNIPLEVALLTLIVGRADLGLLLSECGTGYCSTKQGRSAHDLSIRLDRVVNELRSAETCEHLPRGLFARAVFHRSMGDWEGTARDLDEVEEIAEPGPMKLHLCDMALERIRLAFARIEAFAPLNGLIDDGPPKPVAPDAPEVANFEEDARKELVIVAEYIKTCGYHRRDEELAELEAVLHGERKFTDLPPRV